MIRRQVYGWDEVTDQEIIEFMWAVDQLEEKMLPIDADGDSPVNIHVIDRRKYEPMHWQEVPYSHKDIEGCFEAVLFNLRLAVDRMSEAMWLKKDIEKSGGA